MYRKSMESYLPLQNKISWKHLLSKWWGLEIDSEFSGFLKKSITKHRTTSYSKLALPSVWGRGWYLRWLICLNWPNTQAWSHFGSEFLSDSGGWWSEIGGLYLCSLVWSHVPSWQITSRKKGMFSYIHESIGFRFNKVC